MSGRRTVIAWMLLSIWGFLMIFGVVSLIEPQWLERLGERGRNTEAFVGRNFGDLAFRRGEYDRAIAEYTRSLKIDPDAPSTQLNLGVAYLQVGQVAPAREALEKADALATMPRLRARIQLHLGDLARAEGQPDEALQHYQAALGPVMRPDFVYRSMGAIHLDQRNYALACEDFERCLAAQKDLALPYHEMINRARDATDAEKDVQQWLETWGAHELSDADWARLDRQSLLEMQASDPEIAKTHNHLGLIYYGLKRPDRAIAHFESSLVIWPGNRDAVKNLRVLKELTGSAR